MKPKMILFDYGQTLCVEPQFDAGRGYGAVYDRTDGSLQRYHTVAAPASAPVDDTPQTGVWQTVLNYGRTHWKILLAVGLAMAVLVIVVIVAAVRRSRTVRNSRN